MDEFGFYQEVYPVVLYIGDNPAVVTFHNDTVVEAVVIYNRPETAYPVRLWVEGKGAADGNVTFTCVGRRSREGRRRATSPGSGNRAEGPPSLLSSLSRPRKGTSTTSTS